MSMFMYMFMSWWRPSCSGLAAGLALAGQDLAAPQTKQLLLQLAADAEGHPDNVAPAIYGGFQAGRRWGGRDYFTLERESSSYLLLLLLLFESHLNGREWLGPCYQVSINTGGAHPQWVTQRVALPQGMQAWGRGGLG